MFFGGTGVRVGGGVRVGVGVIVGVAVGGPMVGVEVGGGGGAVPPEPSGGCPGFAVGLGVGVRVGSFVGVTVGVWVGVGVGVQGITSRPGTCTKSAGSIATPLYRISKWRNPSGSPIPTTVDFETRFPFATRVVWSHP